MTSIKVEKATVSLHHVRLPIGILLDSVEISGKSLGVAIHPIQLNLPHPATMKVEISAANLEAFLVELKLAGARDLKVELLNERVVVRGIIKMMIDLKFKAVCTLRIFQERQLHVEAESVEVLGKGATNLLQPQLAKMNPVLDVKEFPFPVTLSAVRITDHRVEVTGLVSPPPEFLA